MRSSRHRVTARPRQKLVPPPAVRDDRDVAAVREDLRAWVRRVGRAEAAWGAHRRGRFGSGLLGRTRLDDGRLAWDPLLQEEFGRLDSPVRMEPVDHHVAQEDVGDGDKRHSLVVRQVGLHDDAGAGVARPLSRRLVRLPRRVVDGVVVSERPLDSLAPSGVAGFVRLWPARTERPTRSRRERRRVRRPALASTRGPGRRTPCTGSYRAGRANRRRTRRFPTELPLATVPICLLTTMRQLWSRSVPGTFSSGGAASGTRTSSRSRRRASGRLPR